MHWRGMLTSPFGTLSRKTISHHYGVRPLGSATVVGPCGSSSISVNRSSTNVQIRTSYHVRLPVTTRAWNVTLFGIAGVASYNFSGGATETSWATYAVVPYPSGGFGNVTPGSFVILTDGEICSSGSPGAGF